MVQSLQVEPLTWPEFLEWFGRKWEPGQHMAFVAPTGEGKTYVLAEVLRLRSFVLALDPKGGDTTLNTLTRHGFTRVTSWPWPAAIREQIGDGKPTRLIVGKFHPTSKELAAHKQLIAKSLDYAFDSSGDVMKRGKVVTRGGWTVAIDELQVMADRRMMNLSAAVERHLILARDRKSSLLTAYQRPAWVPKSAAQMATWFVVMYTRDLDAIADLAHNAGRSAAEMRGTISGLADLEHSLLVFSRAPRSPIIVTRAD